ncbi:MAG: amidohydrolase family protein [Gemmatimonadaceae bacterium]
MRTLAVSATVASIAATVACHKGAPDVVPLAVTHVSVVDVVAGAILTDMTVIVSGNRISFVGPAASAPTPRNARLVDGRSKFLIPGLWDMHVHAFTYRFSDFAGPLMIDNGITGARDMGYYIDTTLRWKREIVAGREVGPRLVVGVRVDGARNQARFVAHVVTREDGVRAVDTLSRNKDGTSRADFIKTYLWIPRAAYYALADEAKSLGIPFAGHVPYSISVIEASNAGQRSLEHEDDLMRACSRSDSLLRSQLGDTARLTVEQQGRRVTAQAAVIRATYDPAQCSETIAQLARNHTWLTPTLVVYQPFAHGFDSASTHPEWARYVPGVVRGGWLRRMTASPARDSISVRSYFSFDRTRDLNKAGVRLLAGTDAPQAFVFPGFSLHDELGLLVKSGLTPLEALRTATYNPAEYLGALDSLGTVAKGKLADLVLLDANPLLDIANTRRISAVIANGRLFDTPARARLLDAVATAVKQ